MRLLSRIFMPIMLLLFSGVAAHAQNAGWTISEAKGSVMVIDAQGQRAATTGAAVVPGAMVRTAAKSTAVLVRGREFVTLRQNAQIRIPQTAPERSLVQVIQDYGSALFNIGKKADPHFGVQTPYLAAVVKGTTFIITVGEDGASLQVTEGAVEVATPDGGARDLILPGAVAMVASGDMMRLVVEGEGRKVIDSPARPASAPAASSPASAAAPARIQPAAAASDNAPNRVREVIASSPGDVRSLTGGFASGEVSVIAAIVVSENTSRGSAPAFGTQGGRGSDGAVCYQGSCAAGGNGAGGNGNSNGDNGNGNGSGSDAGSGGDSGNGDGNSGSGQGNGNGNGGGNGDDGNNGNGNGNGNGGGSGNGSGSDAGSGNGNSNAGGNGNGNGNAGGNGNGNGDGNGSGNGDGNNGNGNGDGNGNGGGNGDGNNGNGNGNGGGNGDGNNGNGNSGG
ncbi:FecR family protein, partial [Porphyrobacter sp. AAP60]|uniref:FecR family protein n=1 Tax=Porphyrobacter sp. AAP60 TaxID=1523423 RepID=UPI0018D16F71